MTAKKEGKTSKASKTSKTNKTAHVLSLLTDPDEGQAETEVKTETASDQETAPAPAAPPAPSVLEVVRANDDAISGKIKGELTKELEMEMAGEALAAQETTAPLAESAQKAVEPTQAAQAESVPAPTTTPAAPAPEAQAAPTPAAPAPEAQAVPTPTAPAPEAQDAPTPAVPVPGAQAAPTPAAPAPEAQAAPTPAAPAPEAQTVPAPLKDITCMNVMQALVEEKADKYIAKFGICPCARCKIDVMALALTNLPAKYVVVRESEAIPMLTVYEGRYNAAVISQVMWACKRVMDFPRH